MKKVILTLFVIVALFLNFSVSGKADKKDISLDFVSALQVSAAEAWCKPPLEISCKITLPNGIILEGIGIAIYEE